MTRCSIFRKKSTSEDDLICGTIDIQCRGGNGKILAGTGLRNKVT